jgi:hypothetical protein
MLLRECNSRAQCSPRQIERPFSGRTRERPRRGMDFFGRLRDRHKGSRQDHSTQVDGKPRMRLRTDAQDLVLYQNYHQHRSTHTKGHLLAGLLTRWVFVFDFADVKNDANLVAVQLG